MNNNILKEKSFLNFKKELIQYGFEEKHKDENFYRLRLKTGVFILDLWFFSDNKIYIELGKDEVRFPNEQVMILRALEMSNTDRREFLKLIENLKLTLGLLENIGRKKINEMVL